MSVDAATAQYLALLEMIEQAEVPTPKDTRTDEQKEAELFERASRMTYEADDQDGVGRSRLSYYGRDGA
jgi:hypothetical protein